jgi:threonine dehydrogenase-like Zn-dependent dehydrogenase
MRGLWLEEGRITSRADLPRAEPGAGEARVRVLLAGVCNTDLEVARGYLPFRGIPGHEFVGEVEAAPSAPHWVGRRVVGEISVACGACHTCREVHPRHCERRTVLGLRGRDGAFAESLVLPVRNLHAVPAELPLEAALFTEPLAAALRVAEQVALKPGTRLLVVGAGKLACLLGLGLRALGHAPMLAARSHEGRERLRALGLDGCLLDEAPPRGADVVVDCSGSPAGLPRAAALVRPLGTIVLKSTCAGQAAVDLSSLVVDEVTVVGSRCGPFAPALELLARGAVDPRPLIEARYGLAAGPDAFDHAGRAGALKVLLDCA